jgi:hypothetical protein
MPLLQALVLVLVLVLLGLRSTIKQASGAMLLNRLADLLVHCLH